MVKRILIDASHPDETRVVVLNGNRLEEFDYESTARTQLKGNIYLAKVTRVEPSLQAAFVEYGGNRHGFLPFSEIHPDYYRIPIADREALIAEEARLSKQASDDEADGDPESEADENGGGNRSSGKAEEQSAAEDGLEAESQAETQAEPAEPEEPAEAENGSAAEVENGNDKVQQVAVESRVDTVGGDEVEDAARKRAKLLRRYKIQEVIKRRQVILVQVSKEERGNKGAALTTYLSLAGRYCVLMPNTGRGGGISRKIGNASDRRRLKKIIAELDIPEGMAVIVRTAGSQRSKAEIRRDYEYLIRLWDQIRAETLQSTAPALIHEEANLIKRAIRDLYDRDMDEIQVQGEEGCKAAKGFMKNLMPSHARKVLLYKDSSVPLFLRHKVESQLDAMHSSSVQLKSGGYIVINPTEALVAIDVNSGKATRERHIEETALNTNNEAAEEVARQLRLRDLAGLIVIDFIDMEEPRHNREVERRFKEAMRHDRARIQLGRISPFGLLEMSRQRLRPSLFDTSTELCSRCSGTGHTRTSDSAGLQILRSLEEEALRRGGGEMQVVMPSGVAFHMLNERRARLVEIEQRYNLDVKVEADDRLVAHEFKLERLSTTEPPRLPVEEVTDDPDEEDGQRRRRGRRRRRRRDEGQAESTMAESATAAEDQLEERLEAEPEAEDEAEDKPAAAAGPDGDEDDERRRPRRRRGKRGGRRRGKRRDGDGEETAGEVSGDLAAAEPDAAADSEAPPAEADVEPAAPQAMEEAAEPSKDEDRGDRPKPRRRTRQPRRTAKRDEVEAAPSANGSAEASDLQPDIAQPDIAQPDIAQPDIAATPAETSEDAPAKRRPRRRSPAKERQPAAASDQPEAPVSLPLVEPAQEPRVLAAAPAPYGDSPAPSEFDAGIEGDEPPPAAQMPPAERGPAAGLTESDDDRPKRRGWWQRWS